jgi:peptide/nickel transport system substrate-binding protein/oligopeptide transport system substrate-binding protein
MQPDAKLVKNVLLSFCSLLMLLLVGCGGGSATPNTTSKADANKQILILPLGGSRDLKTIDPALSTDAGSITAIDLVFTGLVQLDDKLQVRDQLAASHSVSPDGLTWTFKLRPNLTFSDGQPLTSADVAYSIDRALQPAVKSGVAPIYLALIKDADKLTAGKIKTIIGDGILTPDPNTVVIITTKKAPYFLDALTYSCSYVIEKSMIEQYGNTGFADHLSQGIGGDGPFVVSKYEHGKEIEFVPNPRYYGPKPQLKKVVIPFYSESDTTYRAYQAGQVDQSIYIPSAELAAAKALPQGQFHAPPQLWISYYAMNYLMKPFDNIKIRQAFALAINKETLAHDIYKDGAIATNHIVPQGMPGYNADLTGPAGVKGVTGDKTLAKQLFQEGMKEAGYTLANFPQITFTVSTNGRADTRNEFQVDQQAWQNVLGVTVKIDDIEYNKFLSDIPANVNNPNGVQMYAWGWIADYPDPQDWLTLQFDKGVPNNTTNYGQNKSADAAQQQATQKLMEMADETQDQAQRLTMYHQAEQQLVNDAAWIPTVQVTNVLVRKPCVVGMVDNAQSLIPPDDWTNVYISTNPICANASQYA